jgi:hypothetical protein
MKLLRSMLQRDQRRWALPVCQSDRPLIKTLPVTLDVNPNNFVLSQSSQ